MKSLRQVITNTESCEAILFDSMTHDTAYNWANMKAIFYPIQSGSFTEIGLTQIIRLAISPPFSL